MIGRNPKNKDAKASRFIGKATVENKRELVQVWLNVDAQLLARVDAMARSMGLTRSAFMISAVARELNQLEGKG